MAKENGLDVFMHSCGKIVPIIPLLIEAGVDVFQFDQPTFHGTDVLKTFQEQAKVTYWPRGYSNTFVDKR